MLPKYITHLPFTPSEYPELFVRWHQATATNIATKATTNTATTTDTTAATAATAATTTDTKTTDRQQLCLPGYYTDGRVY